jgi:hypothetical protein
LSITTNEGYEPDAVSTTPSVTLSGNGNTRTFTMPASNITVNATFKKTQAQQDKEAVEAAKAAIEGGTYRVAMATANDAASVKTWLASTLNILFGQSHGLQVKSAQPSIVGDVAITAITPAVAGTEVLPDGTNGSFTFTVTLTRGETTLTATVPTGVIVATPSSVTPLKRIELLLIGDLTARILNTGNVATGDLTLALSGTNADAFTVETQSIASLQVGGEVDITLTPRAGLAVGTYTATLTVSGEGLTETVMITYTVTPTGIENPQSAKLYAVSTGGGLQVCGLIPGETLAVYSMSGQLIYSGKATATEQLVPLNVQGIYIAVSGNRRVKTVY